MSRLGFYIPMLIMVFLMHLQTIVINGYEEKNDKLLKVNDELLALCGAEIRKVK